MQREDFHVFAIAVVDPGNRRAEHALEGVVEPVGRDHRGRQAQHLGGVDHQGAGLRRQLNLQIGEEVCYFPRRPRQNAAERRDQALRQLVLEGEYPTP
jgi:hypothetical protein